MTATHSDPGTADSLGGEPVDGALGGEAGATLAGRPAPVRPSTTPAWIRRVMSPFRGLPPWAPPVAIGGLALTSCIYVGLVDPNTTNSAFYPQCAFKALTGLDCPGCGLTRAMHAVVTGHPMRALDHNVLVALVLPLAVYTYVVWMTRSLFGWKLPYLKLPKPVAYSLAPLLVAFWVLRNLPFAPFTYLNSTAAGV